MELLASIFFAACIIWIPIILGITILHFWWERHSLPKLYHIETENNNNIIITETLPKNDDYVDFDEKPTTISWKNYDHLGPGD